MERYINKNEYHQFAQKLDQLMNKTFHDHTDLPNLKDLKTILKQIYNIMAPLLPLWELYNPCFKIYDDTLLNNSTKYWGIQLTNYKVSEAEFFEIYNKSKTPNSKMYFLSEIVDTEWLLIPIMSLLILQKYNITCEIQEVKYKTYSIIPVLEITKNRKVGMTTMNDNNGERASLLLTVNNMQIDAIKLFCEDINEEDTNCLYEKLKYCNTGSTVQPYMQLYLFFMSVPKHLHKTFFKKFEQCINLN